MILLSYEKLSWQILPFFNIISYFLNNVKWEAYGRVPRPHVKVKTTEGLVGSCVRPGAARQLWENESEIVRGQTTMKICHIGVRTWTRALPVAGGPTFYHIAARLSSGNFAQKKSALFVQIN